MATAVKPSGLINTEAYIIADTFVSLLEGGGFLSTYNYIILLYFIVFIPPNPIPIVRPSVGHRLLLFWLPADSLL